ncbi:RNA-directed DNA polymerase, eukaryota, partial [Tanacetum coccineum]
MEAVEENIIGPRKLHLEEAKANYLSNVDHLRLKDLRQRAKCRWALEGDENSKFFHGVINSKRNRSRINGLNIQDAVWCCWGEKAPGPDGLTFKLLKKRWDVFSSDIISYVKEFEIKAFIAKGCKSSFIALVTKVDEPLSFNDYRPISLIGCQYKIIAKVLANRLVKVISSVVSEVQMAFIKGGQTIDGPLIVDEIISWAKLTKRKMFFLNVDFEKAFDSLDWSFLDSIMTQMGISIKWKNWISACLNSAYASVLVNRSPTSEFKIEK